MPAIPATINSSSAGVAIANPLWKNRKQYAQHHINGYLGGRCRKKNGDHRGCVGIGIGQPEMQGKQCQLQRNADHDEGEAGFHRFKMQHAGQNGCQILHIQAAGLGIDQAHADQIEGGADRAHDQVLIGGGECLPLSSKADQRIGGE